MVSAVKCTVISVALFLVCSGDVVECVPGPVPGAINLTDVSVFPAGTNGASIVFTTDEVHDFVVEPSATSRFVRIYSPSMAGFGAAILERKIPASSGLGFRVWDELWEAPFANVGLEAHDPESKGIAVSPMPTGQGWQITLASSLTANLNVSGAQIEYGAKTLKVTFSNLPPDRAEPSPAEYRVFKIRYADPLRIAFVLMNTSMVAPGQIQVYDDKLIKVSYSEGQPAPDGTPQVFVESKGDADSETPKGLLDPTAAVESKTIQSLAETDVSSSPERFIVINGSNLNFDRIREVISELDQPPAVIDLEIRVCEVSATGIKNLGTLLQGVSNSTARGTPGPSFGTVFAESEQDGASGGFEAFSLGDYSRSNGFDIDVVLNTLMDSGYADVLAAPVLSTVDGHEAGFFAGEEVPYVKGLPSALSDATIGYFSVGVDLRFRPRMDHVTQSLTIDVRPTVSSITEFREVAKGFIAPRVSNRRLNTVVRLKDGECFAMAGLIRDEEVSTTQKVPLLGDLPLVGKLFRNKNKRNERTEIIVFVTPRIRHCDTEGCLEEPQWDITDEWELPSEN